MRRDAFAIDSSKPVANKAERFVPLTLPSGPCHGFCPFDDDPSWVETIHTRERPPSLKKLGRSDAEGAVQRDSYPLLHPEVNRSNLPRKDNVGLFGLDDAQVISLGEVSKATVNPGSSPAARQGYQYSPGPTFFFVFPSLVGTPHELPNALRLKLS